MNKFCLKLILSTLVILVFPNVYAQKDSGSPYALFGDNTPVLDSSYSNNNNQNWTLVILMPDSSFACVEIKDKTLTVKDSNGNILTSQTINPTAYARFTTVDPKAVEMPWASPYQYCFGDPINFIDNDGLRPTESEAAFMANIVYNKSIDKLPKELTDANWKISHFPTSIKMNHTAWHENGLQSMLFERNVNGKTEYAYVYAGTNSVEDVLEDIAQIVGLAPQYNTAIQNAKALSEELGSFELTFVGHSLGGGEAAAASMATGRAAITFNPAAVSPFTSIFNHLGNPSNIINYRTVPKGNGFIRLGGCFVNNLQNNLGMRAPGTTINIPVESNNPFTSHQIKCFIDYFRNKQ